MKMIVCIFGLKYSYQYIGVNNKFRNSRYLDSKMMSIAYISLIPQETPNLSNVMDIPRNLDHKPIPVSKPLCRVVQGNLNSAIP